VAVAAAVALLGTGTVIGANLALRAQDARAATVFANGMSFSIAPETAEAAHWLGERHRLLGAGFTPDLAVESLRIELVGAEGVEIPDGDFEASRVVFNEAGEVVEIEMFTGPDAGCRLAFIRDPADPTAFVATGIGTCDPGPCTLFIDLPTLGFGCGCID
jgi:hypothetical protein